MEQSDLHTTVDGLSYKKRIDHKKVDQDEEEYSLEELSKEQVTITEDILRCKRICNKGVDDQTNNGAGKSSTCSNNEFDLCTDEKPNSKHGKTCSALGNQLLSMYEVFTFCTVCEKAFHDGFRYKIVPLSHLLWECADSEGKCKAGIQVLLPSFLEIGKHVCQESIKDNKVSQSFMDSRITVYEENCQLKQFKKKFILTRYTKVKTCLNSEICDNTNKDSKKKTYLDPEEYTREPIVYSYKKDLKEMIRYLGYEYVEDLPKLYAELGQYKCSKCEECPAVIRFLKGIAISQVKKHTCVPNSTHDYKNVSIGNYRKKRIYPEIYSDVQGVYIIYDDDNTEYVPEIDPNSTLKYYWSKQNKEYMVSYMGYKYVICYGRKSAIKGWRCLTHKSCSAILKIVATDEALLQLGEHMCKGPLGIEGTTNSIPNNNKNELVSNFESKLKCEEENNVKMDNTRTDDNVIDHYRSTLNVTNVILETPELESEKLRYDNTSDNTENKHLNKSIYLDDPASEHGTNKSIFQWNNVKTTDNCYKGKNLINTKYSKKNAHPRDQKTNSTRALFVPNLNNEISGNDDTKGLMTVKIINHSFQDVPPDEQTNYEEILKTDKYLNVYLPQLLFKGYKHFKERDSLWPNEMISCPCINKHSLNCPGMVLMKQDKIINYMKHLCKDEISNRKLPQLDPYDIDTVLLHYNISVGETEALYRGFNYRKLLRTNNYSSVYQCVGKPLGCRAQIKLFSQTNLLRRIEDHTCTFNKSNDFSVTEEEKIIDVDKLPKIVFVDEDEPSLIYGGHLYNQIMTDTIWSCVEAEKKGCKGLLHIKHGIVTSVSEHTCLYINDRNKDMFSFQDRRTGEKYAMYLGYVYKRRNDFPESSNQYLWNCLRSTSNKCPGVLTTVDDKVVAVLDHSCSHKDHNVDAKDSAIMSNVKICKNTQDEKELKIINSHDYEGHNISIQEATRTNYCIKLTSPDSVVDGYKIIDNKKEQDVGTLSISNDHNMLTRLPFKIPTRPIPVFQDGCKSFLIYNGFIYSPLYYKNNPMKTYLNWVCFNYQNKRCTGQIFLKKFWPNGCFNYYASAVSRHTCLKYLTNDDMHFFQSTDAGKSYASYRGCIYEKFWALNRNQNIYRWNCLGRKTKICRGILTTKNKQVVAASAHNCNYKDDDGVEGKVKSCTGYEICPERNRDTEEVEDNSTDATDLNIVNYNDRINSETVKTFTKIFKQEDGTTIEEMYIKNDCDEYNVGKVQHAFNGNMVGYWNLEDKHDSSCSAKICHFRIDKLGRKRKLTTVDPKICPVPRAKYCDADTNVLQKVNVLDFTCQDVNSEEHQTEFPYNQYLARYSYYYPKQLKFRSYTYLKQLDTRLSYEKCVYMCSNKDMQDCPGLLRLQYNKMMEYIEHSCVSRKESVNLTLTLHEVDPKNETVLFYNNRLSGEKEALFKCYTFTNPVDRDYFIIWTCMNKKCTAIIKLFPRTCLLREIENHTCSLASHPFITCVKEDGSNDIDQAETIKIDEIWDNTTDTDIEIKPQFINDPDDDIKIEPQFINNSDIDIKLDVDKIDEKSIMGTELCSEVNKIKAESFTEIFTENLKQETFEDTPTCSGASYLQVNCKEEIDVDVNAFEEKYYQ